MWSLRLSLKAQLRSKGTPLLQACTSELRKGSGLELSLCSSHFLALSHFALILHLMFSRLPGPLSNVTTVSSFNQTYRIFFLKALLQAIVLLDFALETLGMSFPFQKPHRFSSSPPQPCKQLTCVLITLVIMNPFPIWHLIFLHQINMLLEEIWTL